jgi:hypothetical protein
MAEIRTSTEIKVYHIFRPHTTREALQKAPGFRWDEAHWISPSLQNQDFGIHTHYDSSKEGLDPRTFFRSGIGGGSGDLYLRHIRRQVYNKHFWDVGIRAGHAYFNDLAEYVHAQESIFVRPDEDGATLLTEDMLTVNLADNPKSGPPIEGFIFSRSDNGDIEIETRFSRVTDYTPRVSNGHFLSIRDDDDELIMANLDDTKREFVVEDDSDDYTMEGNVNLGQVASEDDLVLEAPDDIDDPVFVYPESGTVGTVYIPYPDRLRQGADIVEFSRSDLFVENISWGETGPFTNGQWAYSDEDRIVKLYLDEAYFSDTPPRFDLGCARLRAVDIKRAVFNGSYVERQGILAGTSRGQSSQMFLLGSFPYIDRSTLTTIDLTNISLYVGGDETVGTKWTRIPSFVDSAVFLSNYTDPDDLANITLGRVYVFDSINGIIYFGDEEDGYAVPRSGSEIYFYGYLTPVIVYEPSFSGYLFYNNSDNPNPLFNRAQGQFLVLSKSSNNPAAIYLSLYRPDLLPGTETTEPITHSDTDVYLVAKVVDLAGNALTNVPVEFEIINEVGELVPYVGTTDGSGTCRVRYVPPFLISSYGVDIPYYYPGTSEDETPPQLYIDPEAGPTYPFKTKYLERDTLVFASSKIEAGLALADTYLFNVSSEDPLQPYNSISRTGGRLVAWYRNIGTEENPNNQLVIPIELALNTSNQWEMTFPITLPSPYPEHLGSGDSDLLTYLQKAIIIMPLIASFRAYATTIYGQRLKSNIVTANVELSTVAKGVWTLPQPTLGVWDGSAITTATYIRFDPEGGE